LDYIETNSGVYIYSKTNSGRYIEIKYFSYTEGFSSSIEIILDIGTTEDKNVIPMDLIIKNKLNEKS
jgi:hypothetical protein